MCAVFVRHVQADFFSDLFGASFSSDWAWTDRLGLAFNDDCQESRGLMAVWAWAESWLSGRGGRQRSAHCETKEAQCPAGAGGVTGLRVRSGHARRGGNRELYDFSINCGEKWRGGWLGLHFDGVRQSDVTVAAGTCPSGAVLTGVQVMRGRDDGPNARDYYTFKCAHLKVSSSPTPEPRLAEMLIYSRVRSHVMQAAV